MTEAMPSSIDETHAVLGRAGYVADRSLATVLYLSLKMQRPLFLEGEAGVGKTEIAKVLSSQLGRPLIRLQCYEGLDIAAAVYEWNYAAQMLEIRMSEAAGGMDKCVNLEPATDRLLDQLAGAIDVPKRANRVRPTTGDDVGGLTLLLQFVCKGLHLGVHVGAATAF